MTREECCAVVSEKEMPMTVYDMVAAMQEKFASRPAFRWVDDATTTVKEKTYGEFVADIRKMTGYLQANVADLKGQRIVILSRTNYEYGVVTFGTMMAGAVVVTLNQKKTWPELEYELGLSEPALIFTDGIDYGYAEELKAAYGDKLRPMNAYEGSEPAAFENRIDPDGLRMLLFTSGTTGRSKGVMLSEKNYFTAMKMYIDGQKVMPEVAPKLAPKDMDQPFSHFTLVPMFHLSGFICYFAYGIQGWTLNLCADPRDLRRDMSMMHSDAMSTPPVLVEMIYNEIRRGNQEKLNGLWNLSCSSAILDPQILRYLVEHGIYINQCYSMTELAGYGLLNVVQEGEHLRALGKPDGFCEVKLDETGEICVRGGAVMLGYYKDPEATAEAIDKDGWLHSGDLARVDEDGFYYITGRKKNLIILDSGENVSPEELEKLLGKCADIKECIVKEMGKKIGAVICCEPEKEQAVRTFVTELNRTLPLYKRISAVECTAEPLPRNALGKLLRR
jgi:long-chain acyl-CoA synthetase